MILTIFDSNKSGSVPPFKLYASLKSLIVFNLLISSSNVFFFVVLNIMGLSPPNALYSFFNNSRTSALDNFLGDSGMSIGSISLGTELGLMLEKGRSSGVLNCALVYLAVENYVVVVYLLILMSLKVQLYLKCSLVY